MAGAAACAGDDGDDLPPPASPPRSGTPSPTTPLDPRDAAASDEILAAFDSYMEALIELSIEGVPGGTEETLDRLEDVHVSGEAFNELAFGLLTANAMAGHATAGRITWEAKVLEIDWDHTFDQRPDEPVPLATVGVCFDETNWTTIDQETGEVVDGPGARYSSTVTVAWHDEDPDRPEQEARWEVAFREDEAEPC
jgi:hypothetical protein